jgi:hypothetical protein
VVRVLACARPVVHPKLSRDPVPDTPKRLPLLASCVAGSQPVASCFQPASSD